MKDIKCSENMIFAGQRRIEYSPSPNCRGLDSLPQMLGCWNQPIISIFLLKTGFQDNFFISYDAQRLIVLKQAVWDTTLWCPPYPICLKILELSWTFLQWSSLIPRHWPCYRVGSTTQYAPVAGALYIIIGLVWYTQDRKGNSNRMSSLAYMV